MRSRVLLLLLLLLHLDNIIKPHTRQQHASFFAELVLCSSVLRSSAAVATP
jgi:hypothetical protein